MKQHRVFYHDQLKKKHTHTQKKLFQANILLLKKIMSGFLTSFLWSLNTPYKKAILKKSDMGHSKLQC